LVKWDLWWTKWCWGRFFSEYFGFPCQSSFHQLLHNHPHLSSGAGTIGQKWPHYKGLCPTPLALKNELILMIYFFLQNFSCKEISDNCECYCWLFHTFHTTFTVIFQIFQMPQWNTQSWRETQTDQSLSVFCKTLDLSVTTTIRVQMNSEISLIVRNFLYILTVPPDIFTVLELQSISQKPFLPLEVTWF
jgi:hypothetical protein